tara:strand:- start:8307 stop:8978 length:672 start_codon:yes stop_codon:yes gene_type:complete
MKFLKYFIALIIFNLSFNLIAQTDPLAQDLRRGNTFRTFDLRTTDLEGTVYVNEEFQPAKINNDKKLYFARYDAYHNEMEVNAADGVHYLPKSYNLPIQFTNTNKVYQVFDYKKNNEQFTEFFVVLSSGNIKLLVLEDIEYFEGVKAKSSYETSKPAKLLRAKDEYYISLEDNLAIELSKKKKDFLSIFNDKSEKIDSYMKENKLSNKDQEDLIKIFSYYDSL